VFRRTRVEDCSRRLVDGFSLHNRIDFFLALVPFDRECSREEISSGRRVHKV